MDDDDQITLSLLEKMADRPIAVPLACRVIKNQKVRCGWETTSDSITHIACGLLIPAEATDCHA